MRVGKSHINRKRETRINDESVVFCGPIDKKFENPFSVNNSPRRDLSRYATRTVPVVKRDENERVVALIRTAYMSCYYIRTELFCPRV